MVSSEVAVHYNGRKGVIRSTPVWHAYDVTWQFVVGYDAPTSQRVDAATSPEQAIVIAVRLVEQRLGLPKNHFGNLKRIKRWFYQPEATRVSDQPVLKLRRRPVWQQLSLGLRG